MALSLDMVEIRPAAIMLFMGEERELSKISEKLKPYAVCRSTNFEAYGRREMGCIVIPGFVPFEKYPETIPLSGAVNQVLREVDADVKEKEAFGTMSLKGFGLESIQNDIEKLSQDWKHGVRGDVKGLV